MKKPTEQDIQEAVKLLHDAHQRLLVSNNFVADSLIYRAILHLSDTNDQPTANGNVVRRMTAARHLTINPAS